MAGGCVCRWLQVRACWSRGVGSGGPFLQSHMAIFVITDLLLFFSLS